MRESVKAAPEATVVGAEGVPVNAAGVFVGDPTATFPAADPDAKNFLIVGDDSHACVDPDSPWAGAADPERSDIGQRSDTIMVVRIDPVTKRAAILSFPRDLWVKVPGHGRSRINSAYRKGDYSLLAQTLFDNFGIKLDHYVQVDFCAFKTIVDAVGGVKVPFEFPAKDDHVNLHIDAPGCHTFSGDEALAYVRSRYYEYQDANGKWKLDNAYDLGRVSRQQDFSAPAVPGHVGQGRVQRVRRPRADRHAHQVRRGRPAAHHRRDAPVPRRAAGGATRRHPDLPDRREAPDRAEQRRAPTADRFAGDGGDPRPVPRQDATRRRAPGASTTVAAADETTAGLVAVPAATETATTVAATPDGSTGGADPATVATEPQQDAKGIVPPADVAC